MTREKALKSAETYFDDGQFLEDLKRRVAIKTESQIYECRKPDMNDYMNEMVETFEELGYETEVFENPSAKAGHFFFGHRHENSNNKTVLTYGHGDVIRGQEERWEEDLVPWELTIKNNKIYGRGTADNKGQHSVNIGALKSILETRGCLGFNSKVLIETGEESGSPGLADFAK